MITQNIPLCNGIQNEHLKTAIITFEFIERQNKTKSPKNQRSCKLMNRSGHIDRNNDKQKIHHRKRIVHVLIINVEQKEK